MHKFYQRFFNGPFWYLAGAFVIFLLLPAPMISAQSGAQNQAETAINPSPEALLAEPAGVKGTIRDLITNPDEPLRNRAEIEVFYAKRGYKTFWSTRHGLLAKAHEMTKIIENSWTHGLNPYAYNLKEIQEMGDPRGDLDLARIDVLLTDAFVRLGQDLTGIRIDPETLKTQKRFWRMPMAADYLLGYLDSEGNIRKIIEAIEPKGKTYKRLQAELQHLVAAKPLHYESVLPIKLGRPLSPNQRDPKVPDLRLRMGVKMSSGNADPLLYDDPLAAAIIKFQRANRLKDDAIIGDQTLDLLNRTREQKINQIIANLERLRWVEEVKPDKFVMVNIPSATLWAVENGQVEFEMPVIVGREKRPTNSFIADITGVRFNPDWTVPPTIKKDDILPKLVEDPSYLTQKGMQLIKGSGADAISIDPEDIDWEDITAAELRDLRMVQIPGEHNPLGEIRVLMPNIYNIYLHDTNERQYFERANLAASSGCVRLKDPVRMANFIMRERQDWSAQKLSELIGAKKTRDLFIEKTIPVYLLYYTIWVNPNGQIIYGQDLYNLDEKLINILKNIDGIFIPMDNT